MVRVRRLLVLSVAAVALLATVGPTAAGASPATGPARTGHETTVESVTVPLETVEASRPGTESTSTREVGGDDAVAPFTMIGASYTAPTDAPGRVRVRVDGRWTRWFPLVEAGPDADHGPDAATGEADRPASDPIWVGAGEAFEVSLPAGSSAVTVHLVRDEDVAGGGAVAESAEAAPAATEAGGYTIPAVRPRTDWGAAPYRGSVDTADGLTRAVIHHTVNGNDYSAAQVPSMLRSIQAYHQNTRGWDDIGYNFVIDRFGTVWEGRASSLYQPVIGAHASEANEGSVGIAYLGDGTNVGLTSTAVTNLGRFLGWKLPLHGTRPTRTNIVGHRDVGQTVLSRQHRLPPARAPSGTRPSPSPPRSGPFFDVPDDRSPGHPPALGPRHRRRRRPPGRHLRPCPERQPGRQRLLALALRRGARRPPPPHGFTDIPADAYYREAVALGPARGHRPDDRQRRVQPRTAAVTRQRAVLQLWRYAGQPGPLGAPTPTPTCPTGSPTKWPTTGPTPTGSSPPTPSDGR